MVGLCFGGLLDCNSHRNKLRRAPFTARWRACSEPNNLAIVWPNPYTTPQNINTRHLAGIFILVEDILRYSNRKFLI